MYYRQMFGFFPQSNLVPTVSFQLFYFYSMSTSVIDGDASGKGTEILNLKIENLHLKREN